jgi:dienelactone hydrolase
VHVVVNGLGQVVVEDVRDARDVEAARRDGGRDEDGPRAAREGVERLRAVVADASVDAEVVRYPEGQHGFNCDDRPAVFDAEIAADARQRMLDWFDRHLA